MSKKTIKKSKKKEIEEEDDDLENLIKDSTLKAHGIKTSSKTKSDKRAETSRLNAKKAREAKLMKLKEEKQEEKQEQQNKLKTVFKPKEQVVKVQEQLVAENIDSDEEEILIINPPPIDMEKLQKKNQYYQNLQEIYEWMQLEKQRKSTLDILMFISTLKKRTSRKFNMFRSGFA